MSGRNLDFYMANEAAFDALSDDDKALVFSGATLEGETETEQKGQAEESDATPGTATVVEPAKEEVTPPKAEAAEPVVLAKDGQHTIPFAELEASRNRVKELEQQLFAALHEGKPGESQDNTNAKPGDDNGATAPAIDDRLASLVGERDEALFSGDTDKAKELSLQIIGIQNEIATQAAIAALEAKEAGKKQQDAVQSAYELGMQKAVELATKYDFLNPESPNANADAIDLVISKRDRLMANGMSFAEAIEQAVGKVAPLFEVKTTPQPNTDAAAKAAEVISKAQAKTPTSLSQVPAGSAAHHDKVEAMRNMDAQSLSRSFEGMSAEEAMKMMNKML